MQKKADEAKTKADEATAKATKEAEDVKAAQTKKEEADKAKTEAETELATAKAEAEKAKAKVEELKKEEAETRTALKDALDKLEKDIDADAKITNKEEAKKALGKEDILAAVEKGDLTAGDVLKELKGQHETAEANKNQDPQADKIGATKKEGKPLAELPTADKEKLDAAYNKEASKPIVKKLQDIADDIAEKIEKLTKVADKDKADATEKAKAVEEKNAALDKQKETLEKAKTALATAKKNNAEQSIQDGLQDAVTRLEAAVASAKTAADEAQAKFDEVNEVVKAYKDAIDELTDDYNATLGYIENLKEVPKGEAPKDFAGGVNDEEAPTTPATPEFNSGVNDDNAPTQPNNPEFNGGVNDTTPPTEPNKPEGEAPKPSKPETSNGDALVQPELPEFNGGVNDTTPPTPAKPEGETPKPTKPEASNGDALVQPELPAFKGGVNAVEAAVNEVPEFGVNNPEIKKILDEISKVKEQIKDSEENEGVEDYYKDGLKDRLADLEDALNTLINNKAEVLSGSNDTEDLKVTRYVDIATNTDILNAEEGHFKGKSIAGYTFVKSEEKDGIITNYYKKVTNHYSTPNSDPRLTPTPGNPVPNESQAPTPATPAAEAPTPAPATPTAETPSTPAVAPTVAGTSKDNTYQAPAAKAEDKKELPNTGGKDNVAVASLGFLGLLLGALPFVKRKN